MKVICIGQAAYDITLPVDSFPKENKKIRITNKVECGGGSALNCAYLLAKWGQDVYFVGMVGDDYHGGKIQESLEGIGVNTKYLQISNKYKTTSSYIIANVSIGTRTILTKKDADLVIDNIEFSDEFDVILLDGYEKNVALKAIEENPKAIKILDAGSLKEATVELAKVVDYVVCSRDFAESFSKVPINYGNLQTVVDAYKILDSSFKGKIIITLEDRGCFVYENGFKLIPTLPMKAVDTTGAGDIFHGAFTYAIANGYDIIKALQISNITGALSVRHIGGQNSVPELEEVIEVYDECVK